jgi:methionyl aminopeptidase
MTARRKVPIRTPAEIDKSRVAGRLAAQVLEMISPYVVAGVSTEELDQICHDYIVDVLKVKPANLGYNGYPKTILTSVSHVVCHGIPAAKRLKNGDTVNIDVAVIKDGWFGDTSRMYFVGEPSVLARRLVRTTYDAMRAGIQAVKPGATLGDVGHAIQTVAHDAGFSVVREYCGHGIGDAYHEDLQVLHYGVPGTGFVLKTGMIFTIEPMINAGKAAIKQLADGWTVVTKDHSLSAQWEHMVVVTDTGFEVLTPWPNGCGEYAEIGAISPGRTLEFSQDAVNHQP